MDDYVVDPYPYAKFHHDTITILRHPNMRKCASSDSANFFLVLPTAYSQVPCTERERGRKGGKRREWRGGRGLPYHFSGASAAYERDAYSVKHIAKETICDGF